MESLKLIPLNEPDKTRGCCFMEALSVKASAREWSEQELSLQDLSDLLKLSDTQYVFLEHPVGYAK